MAVAKELVVDIGKNKLCEILTRYQLPETSDQQPAASNESHFKERRMDTINNISFDQLQTLHEVSRKINSQLNLQKLLDEIMDLAVALLKAEKGLILFQDG